MIKIFEIYRKKFHNHDKYEIGDYVLLNDDPKNKWMIDIECEIIKIENDSYQISSFYKNGKCAILWIHNDEISRKMTSEEIEKYEIKKNSEKYNL
jgi:hypothetical protein